MWKNERVTQCVSTLQPSMYAPEQNLGGRKKGKQDIKNALFLFCKDTFFMSHSDIKRSEINLELSRETGFIHSVFNQDFNGAFPTPNTHDENALIES